MGGRIGYVVAHPNGEDHIRVLKGGKVPTFATWAYYEPYSHMEGDKVVNSPLDWYHVGYSYQETREVAERKALPDLKKNGIPVRVTQILPTQVVPKR